MMDDHCQVSPVENMIRRKNEVLNEWVEEQDFAENGKVNCARVGCVPESHITHAVEPTNSRTWSPGVPQRDGGAGPPPIPGERDSPQDCGYVVHVQPRRDQGYSGFYEVPHQPPGENNPLQV